MTLLSTSKDKNLSSPFMVSEVTVSVFYFLSPDELGLENKLERKLFMYCYQRLLLACYVSLGFLVFFCDLTNANYTSFIPLKAEQNS